MIRLQFPSTPPIGTTLEMQRQMFTMVGVEPHTRKDGLESVLMTWTAPCADCGTPFEQQTGLTVKSHLTRRCPEHRQIGKRVR